MSVLLYHFTHVGNIASILGTGRLVCDAHVQAGTATCTDVGDHEVKDRRRTMPVDCGPRGVVADYVPFYYAPRSPMLYVIDKGRVPQYQGGQEPLVYLVTDVTRVQAAGRPVVFSDGNAASALSEFFDDHVELDERIDWALMESRYWHNTLTHPDRMRRRMAEALIHDHVPLAAFTECVAMTDETAAKVSSLFDHQGADMTVRVARDWYY